VTTSGTIGFAREPFFWTFQGYASVRDGYAILIGDQDRQLALLGLTRTRLSG
jgi:hypothetical protein